MVLFGTNLRRSKEVMMKSRFLVTLGACFVAASVLAATAAADPPTREEFSPVGDQIACGDTILTVTEGTVAVVEHVHELRSGLFRVIFTEVARGVRATDEAGTVYRLRGVGHGNFMTPDPEAEGGEVGFFRFKLNIIGRDGLFGTVDFRIRVKRNGEEIFTDRGTCQFVEE
jgi:hypothetical protein